MKRLLSSMIGGAMLISAGIAAADMTTTTTTTWTNEEGAMVREYSVTNHYGSVTDPTIHTTVGTEVPSSVPMYSLPETVKVPDADQYSYVIVNDHPMVVERTTRRVIHVW
jgi:hypothetical protein